MKFVMTTEGGQCAAFPDVCKTPSPGGPIPLPYPNVAMASDGKGSTKVKTRNKETLRKGDSLRMSSGDEAGSIGGVVSNKIKGAAEIKQGYSGVLIEGRDVAYHLVTIGQNGGSNTNQPATGKAVSLSQPNVQLVARTTKKHGPHDRWEKQNKYHEGESKTDADQKMKDAADRRAKATTKQERVNASKDLGDQGALNSANDLAKKNGGLADPASLGVPGNPMTFEGPGAFDVVVFCANGVVGLIEGKGSLQSPLNSAEISPGVRANQGTPQYRDHIINEMENSPASDRRQCADAIKNADSSKVKYQEARSDGSGTTTKDFDP